MLLNQVQLRSYELQPDPSKGLLEVLYLHLLGQRAVMAAENAANRKSLILGHPQEDGFDDLLHGGEGPLVVEGLGVTDVLEGTEVLVELDNLDLLTSENGVLILQLFIPMLHLIVGESAATSELVILRLVPLLLREFLR